MKPRCVTTADMIQRWSGEPDLLKTIQRETDPRRIEVYRFVTAIDRGKVKVRKLDNDERLGQNWKWCLREFKKEFEKLGK